MISIKHYISKVTMVVVVALAMAGGILTSCSRDNKYTIDGVMYGGCNFEGETIYMVPFAYGGSSKIDSATIHDSRFQFTGTASEPEVYILRMRPMMKLFVDELILIREPGHIRTMLSKESSAKGTPLNDSLQAWRNYNIAVKKEIEGVNKRMKKERAKHNDAEVKRLHDEIDSLRNEFALYNKSMADRNLNVVGDFLSTYAK